MEVSAIITIWTVVDPAGLRNFFPADIAGEDRALLVQQISGIHESKWVIVACMLHGFGQEGTPNMEVEMAGSAMISKRSTIITTSIAGEVGIITGRGRKKEEWMSRVRGVFELSRQFKA